MARARSVSLDDGAIARLATGFNSRLTVPAWNTCYHFGDGTPRTANYILLLDALNFSFWDAPRWRVHYRGEWLDGYWALAAALKRAIEEDIPVTDAAFLARLEWEQFEHIFRGEHRITLAAERLAHAREVGRVLLDKYDGSCANLIAGCRFDAPGLVSRVVADFPSFRDEATYDGERVVFYKRAQIFAADLCGAFGGEGLGALKHMHTLTCFADYKLPQILRRFGIMRYAPALAEAVDGMREIPAGSAEEVEIRAATIAAVERLRKELETRGTPFTSVQIDWALWEAAQGSPPDGKPYHRTRSIYY
jgi:hypothetical protein